MAGCTDPKVNPVQICKLVRLRTVAESYGFSLGFHGFYVNGFVYLREKGSVLGPSCTIGPKQIKFVKPRGMQIRYLKQRLEQMIEGD